MDRYNTSLQVADIILHSHIINDLTRNTQLKEMSMVILYPWLTLTRFYVQCKISNSYTILVWYLWLRGGLWLWRNIRCAVVNANIPGGSVKQGQHLPIHPPREDVVVLQQPDFPFCTCSNIGGSWRPQMSTYFYSPSSWESCCCLDLTQDLTPQPCSMSRVTIFDRHVYGCNQTVKGTFTIIEPFSLLTKSEIVSWLGLLLCTACWPKPSAMSLTTLYLCFPTPPPDPLLT